MLLLDTITSFITGIGIQVHFETIEEPTFLPGLFIRNGAIVIDKEKLLYPGDILHEAGHLAVMPPRIRTRMTGNLDLDPIHHGGELGAMAWSYAVCIHLGIEPEIVFHGNGYKGGGDEIIHSLKYGAGIGVPLLVWQGMTIEKKHADNGEPVFPHMKTWLCEVDKYEEVQTFASGLK